MSANVQPIFLLTPNVSCGKIGIANTNRDGTGTRVTAWTAGANGAMLTKVRAIVPTGAASGDTVRLFWTDTASTDPSGSVNTFMFGEVLVTPTTSVVGATGVFSYDFFPSTVEAVPSGWVLSASTHIGQPTSVIAYGGNY